MADRQKVAQIRIMNVMGIEDLEIRPGKVTILEGQNASGKTSVLEAIRAAIGGGNDATLVRKGQDKGEVVLVLEDGTEIKKTLRREGGGQLVVEHPDFGQRRAPQSWLNELADAISVNPVAFLTADPKRQTEILLEAAAFQVGADDLAAAIDDVVHVEPDELNTAASWNGLAAIEHFRRRLYDERTGVNRVAKEQRAVLADLKAAVPEDMEPPGELKDQMQQVNDAIREAQQERDTAIEQVQAEMSDVENAIRERAQERIEQLRREIAEIQEEAQGRIRELDQERTRQLDEIKEAAGDRFVDLHAKRAELEERLRASEHANGLRDRMEEAKREIKEYQELSERLTAGIDRLAALKARQLEHVPIPNLELRDDGVLYADDIPLHRMNHAKLVEIAFWVAKLRAGELGLVCVDGLEALDQKTFDSFTRYAAKRSDLQYIVTRVGQGALSVRTIDEEVEADA